MFDDGSRQGSHLLPQGVQRAARIEPGGHIRGAFEGLHVDVQSLLLLEVAHQRRVHLGSPGQLDFVFFLSFPLGQRNPPEHDRGAELFGTTILDSPPGRHAGSEVSHIDAAVLGEFADLRAQCPCGAAALVIGVDVTQEHGQAGAPAGQELCQPRGVGVGDVDAVGRRTGKAQQGIGSRTRTELL